MELLQKDELKALIEKRDAPCVSIYLPTHRMGKQVEQDPIRFKNLLKRAEERLVSGGFRSTRAKELLLPAQKLLEDENFWRYQSDGLAVFVNAREFRFYRMPVRFDELVVVADRHHIKPLLRVMSGDGRFYLLALSQNRVRFFQGTRFSVGEIGLEGMPTSRAEALKFDLPQKELRFRTRIRSRPGRRDAVIHGAGAGVLDEKNAVLRYFQEIDKGLHKLLRGEQAPMVLAGVDYLHPIYREANTYPHLVESGISGNPDRSSPDALHKKAWKILQPLFERSQKTGAARYRELAGTGMTSNRIEEIAPAAYHGRVEMLLVAVGIQRWGTFDPASGAVVMRSDPRPGDEDLLDFAAVHSLLGGGAVYAVPRERIPDDQSPIVAVFRY